jgi:hypothetical protein
MQKNPLLEKQRSRGRKTNNFFLVIPLAALPLTILPTIEKIYGTYHQGDWRRDHLGASLIGTQCERSLWYTFRWATNPDFSQRMLRLFETGLREELRIIDNLRKAGITVYSEDPDTHRQINYEMFGGHYSGSLDGIAQGFEESKAYHVIECKTANTKTFKSLCKDGIEKVKPEHYAQVQQYIKWAGLERAYYLCVAKETDDIYGERIKLNKEFVKILETKAERIIFSDNPCERIADVISDYRCKFCVHKGLCFFKQLPLVSCRTCAYADPLPTGGWSCGRDNSKINRQKQRDGCMHHIFIPALVPLEQTDADADKGTITYYGGVENGPGAILSRDLQETLDKLQSGEIEI